MLGRSLRNTPNNDESNQHHTVPAEPQPQPQPQPDPQPRSPQTSAMTLLSVQGDHARFEGKFQISDSVEVQCEIGGELEVDGKLVIGEQGVVEADVRTVDAVIMGTYEGNMFASGNVEITSTGRVIGNIQTDSLVIAQGGFFNGNVTKINHDEERSRDGFRSSDDRDDD